jgi:restriction endonuclease S subunit
MMIYFPLGESEQKTIVEKLDAVFAEIDQLELNLETKSRYTNELLNSILGSTFSGDDADPNPHQGPAMKTVKLGDLVDLRNGSTPLKTKKEFWDGGDVPWFTIDDFRKQGKHIEFTEKQITDLGFQSSSLAMIPKNSVLLCCTASVGVTAINKIELTTNQQFNALTVKDERIVDPNFIYYWCLYSEDVFKSLGRATTIDYISMSKIRDMDFLLPSFPEQKAIVEKLDTAFAEIDKLRERTKQAKESFSALRQSILSSVFTEKSDAA